MAKIFKVGEVYLCPSCRVIYDAKEVAASYTHETLAGGVLKLCPDCDTELVSPKTKEPKPGPASDPEPGS